MQSIKNAIIIALALGAAPATPSATRTTMRLQRHARGAAPSSRMRSLRMLTTNPV